MLDRRAGVVGVVREFLVVHQAMSQLISCYRDETLSFELVENLVGDENSSPLYRLKEKCHSIFRLELAGQTTEVRTEALFDLAVGSLFHESMILRENLYQQEKYGPRVDALRSDVNPSARELSLEFDKILNSSASRLREAVEEVDVLLALTSDQLVRLLVEECDNDLLARCLYEEKAAVAAVFPRGLNAMLAEVHGSATEGLMRAADSYIESAYYDQALEVLSQVTDGQGQSDSWAFASAMQAFLERDYPRCVEHLSVWLGKDRRHENPSRLTLVIAAARYVEKEHEGQFSPDVRAQLLTLEAQLKVGVEAQRS